MLHTDPLINEKAHVKIWEEKEGVCMEVQKEAA